MSAQFPRLFAPLGINGWPPRNRIVFGTRTANMAVDGVPGWASISHAARGRQPGTDLAIDAEIWAQIRRFAGATE